MVRSLRRALKAGLMKISPMWGVVYRIRDRDRRLYLTFDDGVHPNTPRLLDLLRDANATATFFILGSTVAERPDLVRRMIAEGHAVAGHTHTHCDLVKADAATLARELDASQAALEAASERRVMALRPPWGRFGWREWRAARRRGLRLILWSVDSQEWKLSTAEALLHRLKPYPFAPGDILLLHDDYARTLAALPELLAHLRAQGWELRALPGLNPPLLNASPVTPARPT